MVTTGGVFNPGTPHPGRKQAHNRNQTIKTQNTGGGTIATPAPLALPATALLLSACGGDSDGPAANAADPAGRYEASETALRIAAENIVVDGHIDVPYRLKPEAADVSKATENGDFDYPRAAAGQLNAPFMSIYTPPELEAADRPRPRGGLQPATNSRYST